MEKEEYEAALAAYYFDASGYHSTIRRELLDIRLYLLKHLVNRNSPFVFNIQQKMLQTLKMQFASTDSERKLKAEYLDKIRNIEEVIIKTEKINQNQFYYFFQHQKQNYPTEFHAILEKLLAAEKELLKGIIIKTEIGKSRRYEARDSKDDSTLEVVGCVILIVLLIGLFAAIMTNLISDEAMKIIFIQPLIVLKLPMVLITVNHKHFLIMIK